MRILIITLTTIFLLAGCASSKPIPDPATNPYTSGEVSLTLKKGITTTAEVAKVFGAPNVVSQDDKGNAVWIYQKNAVVTRSRHSSRYITILLAGAGSDTSGFASSAKTMTLIIHFNKAGIVTGFKSLTTSF